MPDSSDEDAVDVTSPDATYDAYDPGWVVPDVWDAPFDYMDIPPDYEPDPEYCGNGVVDPGEECDDGNGIDFDECTNRCLFPRCGDGSIWYGMEDCDPPGTIRPCTTTCGSMGGEWCEPYCRWTGICVPPAEACGNGADDDCDGIVDGIVRITGNVTVSTPPVGGEKAFLAWTGSGFSILWYRYPDELTLTRVDPWGARTSPDVAVTLDFNWITTFEWTGAHYGVVGSITTGGPVVHAYQAFDDTGTALGSSVHIRTETSGSALMRSGSSGSSFFVLVHETNVGEFWGYILDPDGSYILGETLLYDVEPYQMTPFAMAEKDLEYAVLYFDGGLYVDAVDSSGDITSSTFVDTSLELTRHEEGNGDVAWTGTSYGIAIRDDRDLHLIASRTDGTVTGTAPVSNRCTRSAFGEGPAGPPRLLWNGTELGLFWIDSTIGSPQISVARIAEDGTVIMGRAGLTSTPAPDVMMSPPSPVWTGSSYGVAWLDFDGITESILFTHFTVCP